MKGVIIEITAIDQAQLFATLSTGKLMLLLKLVDPNLLDQMEYALEFINECKMECSTTANIFDEFIAKRSLIIEDDIFGSDNDYIYSLLRFFETRKYSSVIEAKLFIDGFQYNPSESAEFPTENTTTLLQ